MVALSRADTFIVDVPTIRPHVLAMATVHAQSMVIVRLTDADGVEGLGEGTTIGGLSYCEESPESIKSAIDTYILPVLETCNLTQVGATMAKVARCVRGNHFAKCAVETALLDMAGKRLGLPASELIGGGRVRDSLPVAWTLASGDTARDIAEGEEMLERRRHNIFKLKIGKRAVRDDVAHVGAICKALGDRASVRVDVNQNWSEAQAKLGMAMLHDVGCDLVEQPIAGDDIAAMARLSTGQTIPLMADEALRGPRTALRIASAGAAGVFALKIAQSGGLFAGAEVAAIGTAAGIGLYGGTMLEGGVGTAASAHVFATVADLAWGTELFGPLLQTEEILSEPLAYGDFSLAVPTGPGLGIALDEDKLDFFRRDRSRTVVDAPALHAVNAGA
ncbi:muconate cycloisomerase family protein [Novosphingobium mangrovi (ex Huang et al. 2023)]|uniref:Muconate cycloisomerase family protein n=1 Tax=Novosphingobium mangrovi (ex Huang et al. 2023) TaxID=2976432 RepID=A0ABT2I9A1_9SPHN|nr:muconate cycloisomerase family protein [Novosphingobium mangrovi (ex Huang et al. 2023)]MCT2401417.1 muconate cycloisomerase family protein [Novosphingobium mangrovi (ex Huang et al. 2023)]